MWHLLAGRYGSREHRSIVGRNVKILNLFVGTQSGAVLNCCATALVIHDAQYLSALKLARASDTNEAAVEGPDLGFEVKVCLVQTPLRARWEVIEAGGGNETCCDSVKKGRAPVKDSLSSWQRLKDGW